MRRALLSGGSLLALAALLGACSSSPATSGGLALQTTTSSTTAPPATTSTTFSTTVPTAPPVPVPADFVVTSISAVTSSHWWVLGYVPCGTLACPLIGVTTDGGRTFFSLPAPDGTFGPGVANPPGAAAIHFANARDGWAYGPNLYATHDGGRHWHQVKKPGAVSALAVQGGSVFAVASTNATCPAGATCAKQPVPYRLWRSPVATNHWSRDGAARNVIPTLAASGASLWVASSGSTPVASATGNVLLHSSDGGHHFTRLTATPVNQLCSFAPVSPSTLWAYCGSGTLNYAYLSTNAGTSFTLVGRGALGGITPDGFGKGASLAAASNTTAVAAAGIPNVPLIVSTNGGSTWTAAQPAPDKFGEWVVLPFLSPTVGFALWQHVGINYLHNTVQLWRTTDGGAHWAQVTSLG